MTADNTHDPASASGTPDRPPVDVARSDPPLGREFVLNIEPRWLESGWSDTIADLLMQHGVLRQADPGPYVLTTRGEPGVWAYRELPNTLAKLLPDLAFDLGIADYLNAVREISYGIAGLVSAPSGGLLSVETDLGLLELVDSAHSFPYPYEYEDDASCNGPEVCQPHDLETAVPVVDHAQCRARGSTLPLRLGGEITRTVLWPMMRTTIGAWPRREQERWWEHQLDFVDRLHEIAYPHLAVASGCTGARIAAGRMAELRRHRLAGSVQYAHLPRRDLWHPRLRDLLNNVTRPITISSE